MAAPILNTVYPMDGDVGIPLGASIVLTFDRSVDLQTIKKFLVVYGTSDSRVTGPDPGSWITNKGEKPFLTSSPSFKSVVPFALTARYLDGLGDVVDDDFADFTEEAAAVVTYEVRATPNKPLPQENLIQYQAIGDPDSLGTGISSRTVWNVIPGVGNAGSTGVIESAGSYTGSVADKLVVSIDTSGAVGTAKYSWYWDSIGVGTGKSGRVTNTGFLTIDKGVAIRFSGSGFLASDTYEITVSPAERVATSVSVGFTTTDNEFTTVPTSPSTPAEQTPPSTVIPPAPGMLLASTLLRVLDINPEEGSYNISVHTDEIVVTFSEPLDPSTVTTDTVKLYAVPVTGIFGGQGSKRDLAYTVVVAGDTLTISF